jgi:hypothetical protein
MKRSKVRTEAGNRKWKSSTALSAKSNDTS